MKFAGIALWIVLLILAGCHADDSQPARADTLYKLSSVSTYLESSDGGFALSEITTYTYSDQGRLQNEQRSLYNSATQQSIPYARKAFTHDSQGRVTLIEATIINTNVEESVSYRYRPDGSLSSMHLNSDIKADVVVTNLPGDTLQAVYLYSTGTSFTYKAFMKDGNPVYDKTVNSEKKMTDESTKSYDDYVNPYSLLGYVDYLFINFSKNNPLGTATQEYIGHQELRPESYEYTYSDAGLPITQIVTYKSSNPSRKPHIKYVFEYAQ